MIGQGAFGEVYKEFWRAKIWLQSRNLSRWTTRRMKTAKELLVHSQINHRNVTRPIGYCLEEDASMMVTEFMSGGNLNDFLHNGDRSICLDTRLRIATECVEALGYMHSHMYTRVIYGDIKPANILLDHDNLNAKISDFRISRLVNIDKTLYTKHVIGSIGYMDPLFVRNGRLTTKSDVYSFEVVLVELFTRKRASTEDGDDSLADSFTKSLSKGFRRVRDKFDAEIVEQSNMKILEEIGKLAGECLSMDSHKRPEMTDVAERLKTLRKAHHQREDKLSLFFWRTKYRPVAPAVKIILTTNLKPQGKPAPSLESRGNTSNTSKLVRFGSMATKQAELEDLLRATVEVLGEGTLRTIYKTYKIHLASGLTLVVKRMIKGLLSEQEFRTRATAISAVESELIVPLRAYYFGEDEKLQVYDYMPMGSLAMLLHGNWGTHSQADELYWRQQLTIALTAAHSLATIHSAGPESCHGNIKSSNVFLTGAYEARLSEHGLLTLFSSSSSLPTTVVTGYRAPDVAAGDTQSVSQEADVLLLELLTGMPPLNAVPHEEGMDLPSSVQYVPREKRTAKVIDARLRRQLSLQEEEMVQLLLLAMACCAEKAAERPEITEVVQRIEYTISDGCR